jgi:DNA-binding NarL/FixJ family response regulator
MHSSANRSAVVLDRQPLWLEALDQVLGRIGVHLVAKSTSPSAALAAIRQSTPDLFVTELETGDPALDGLACILRAREIVPEIRAIVLSSDRAPERINGALAAGASAYVMKTAHADDIASAVRQAFDHSIFLASVPVNGSARPTRDSEDVGLTRRELEILRLVSEGHSNRELARMLWVTEQTVKFHLSNVYRKLDVANRTEAARWAQLNGLLEVAAPVIAHAQVA